MVILGFFAARIMISLLTFHVGVNVHPCYFSCLDITNPPDGESSLAGIASEWVRFGWVLRRPHAVVDFAARRASARAGIQNAISARSAGALTIRTGQMPTIQAA